MKIKQTILCVLLLVLFVGDLLLGSLVVDLSQVWQSGSVANAILFDFRLPKALTALMAGVALALSGLLMQTIFRNPLAGPYVLGVSSGASLAVAIFMLGAPVLGVGFLGQIGIVTAAWVGSAAILLLVLAVSSRLRDIMAVLILGMMLGSAASAFVDLLQYMSSEAALKGFVLWAMGSLGGLSPMQLGIMAGAVLVGVIISISCIKGLDLLLLGENYARSMGLSVQRMRLVVFVATSLLAGSVTAFCGPIAFVGIAAPHIARMFLGSATHRVLAPGSMLVGANMMLLCDILSGLPFMDMVLPINTVAALMGIPVVIMVVINNRWKD